MKAFTIVISAFLAIQLVAPQYGISQGPSGARSTDSAAPGRGGSSPGAGHGSFAGVAASAAAAAASAAGGSASASAAAAAGSYSGYSYGGQTYGGPINLKGTSFESIATYYSYYNYYSYLCSHFNVDPVYFDRFYRNTEPLITPEMLKLTLRTPIRLSSKMLDSIDQLESMLKEAEAGKTVDRQALLAKSKEIRESAKRIRKNQTLQLFDLRESKDSDRRDENGALSPESLDRMRAMAVDLDRQLRNMYSQSSTSTVSVENYKEPSLEALAKGIERLCKAIEKSTKNM